ncbi:hypothetical protein SCOR_02095 [Sulfidibacter corallicola]|uniref:Uncharacterized protein n=1 Tax=Sulfidibacter corallicola TaxID=2818388 RepID=A0A8A4TFF8_SULCO|nr:hypothetical protein [Sulfidibacter corallicola]QTD48686.1 hypothetical protein J3U87_24150 [Sulfidibacter corallicola]
MSDTIYTVDIDIQPVKTVDQQKAVVPLPDLNERVDTHNLVNFFCYSKFLNTVDMKDFTLRPGDGFEIRVNLEKSYFDTAPDSVKLLSLLAVFLKPKSGIAVSWMPFDHDKSGNVGKVSGIYDLTHDQNPPIELDDYSYTSVPLYIDTKLQHIEGIKKFAVDLQIYGTLALNFSKLDVAFLLPFSHDPRMTISWGD